MALPPAADAAASSRPQDPASGRQAQAAFSALVDEVADQAPPAETETQPVDPRRGWSLSPFDLSMPIEAPDEIERDPALEEPASELSLLLPSHLLVEAPEPAKAAKADPDGNATDQRAEGSPARALAMSAEIAGSGSQRLAQAPAVVQPSRSEPGEPKTTSGKEESVPARTADPAVRIVSEARTAPAPATPMGASVAAWADGAASGGTARSDAEAEGASASRLEAAAASATAPQAQGATQSAPAPLTPLALDPPAQSALIQAARRLSEAEIAPNRPDALTETLKLQLRPADLGTVTAVLHSGNGSLAIELQAETQEAHQRLISEKEAIGKALRELGFEVEHVTVHPPGTTASGDKAMAPQLGQGAGDARSPAFEQSAEGRAWDQAKHGSDAGREDRDGQGSSSARPDPAGRSASAGRYI